MSKLYRLTLEDFTELIEFAQQTHYARNESIPRINDSHIDKLESCLNTPFQKVFGAYVYRGFLNKAAVLFYLLIKNHPLSNGNKRMACLALGWFCTVNHYEFRIPLFEYESLAKSVAESTGDIKMEVEMIKRKIGKYISKKKRRRGSATKL